MQVKSRLALDTIPKFWSFTFATRGVAVVAIPTDRSYMILWETCNTAQIQVDIPSAFLINIPEGTKLHVIQLENTCVRSAERVATGCDVQIVDEPDGLTIAHIPLLIWFIKT